MQISFENENGVDETHNFDVTNIFYVLLNGQLLNLETQEITQCLYDDVNYFDGSEFVGSDPIGRCYASFVLHENGQYKYIPIEDVCGENYVHLLQYHFTNDLIFDLYTQYYETYLNDKRIIETLSICSKIGRVIETISNYETGL